MKKIISIAAIALAFASLTSCQKEDIKPFEPQEASLQSKTFSASMEECETRTTFTGDQSVWDEWDQVTVFPGYASAHRYMVKEGCGGSSKTVLVESDYNEDYDGDGKPDTPSDTTPISANVACYPYRMPYYSTNTCTEISSGVFQVPAIFWNDPSSYNMPMVAVSNGTDDMNLPFKNLCGIIKLSFKAVGDGVEDLLGVYVEGNDGEILAGMATVTASYGGDPVVEMEADGGTRLMVFAGDGGDPVHLNDGETCDMYIPIPPTTFSKGLTIQYATMSGMVEKKVSKEVVVGRSHIVPFETIEISPSPTKIYYQTNDDNILTPYRISALDADGNELTYTNTYEYNELFGEEAGTIAFSDRVDKLDICFAGAENLRDFYGASSRVKIKDAQGMFWGCTNLWDATFDGFDFSEVESMAGMFYNCGELKYVDDCSLWDVSSVKTMQEMFRGCASLGDLDVTGWSASAVTDMQFMFRECSNLWRVKGLNTIGASSLQTIRGMFYKCENLYSLDLSGLDTGMLQDMQWAFGYCSSLESIDFTGLNTKNVIDMGLLLYNDYNLLDIKGLETLNTSNVTSMYAMFSGCNALQNINLSKFDTSNVEDFGYIFSACLNLKSLDLSSFNTGKAQSMLGMFDRCQSITRLDLSNFNTGNVTDMSSMFYQCESLSSLDVSSFNTANVTDMQFMFAWLWALPSIDVSNFDTSNVTSMYAMFNNCNGFTHLDLSGFNTSKVTDFSYMFEDSANLQSVDISGFDTSAAQTVESMFATCPKLNSIKVGAKTNMCTFDNTMFSNVAAGGTLHYPAGSDYSFWLSSAYGCLGSYGWNGVEYGGAPYSPAEGGNEGIGYENWD